MSKQSTSDPVKITYGSIYGRDVDSWHYMSVIDLLMQGPPVGYKWSDAAVGIRSGPLLSSGRGQCLYSFVEQTNGDLLTMIDSDQAFSPDLYWNLCNMFIQAREEYPTLGILAGVTWMSGHPKLVNPLPNIWKQGRHKGEYIHLTTYPPDSLIELAAVGCSNLVISREVAQWFIDEGHRLGHGINPFHHMNVLNYEALARDIMNCDDIEKAATTIRDAVWNSDQLGEDLSFCTRVREAGFRIFCHTGLEFPHSKNYLLDGDDYRTAVANSKSGAQK